MMSRRAQCSQHQIEPVGHPVTTYFPLMQFNLMQDGLKFFLFDPVAYQGLDNSENILLKLLGMRTFTALNPAAYDHFTHGFFEATEWRG